MRVRLLKPPPIHKTKHFSSIIPIVRKGELLLMEFWGIIITSAVSYGLMFFITKFVGHKQMAQLDFFDYVTGITIGSIAAELATELEQPWKPVIAMLVFGIVTFLLNLCTRRFPRMRKFLNGTPTILMDNGKLYRENLKKAKLELSEFMVMCRQQGYFDLGSIQTAVFEYNGKLTILPVSTRRAATPQDMGLKPPQEQLFAEVIMDGQILQENLTRMGLTLDWLQAQLKKQGFGSEKEVFLAVCDINHRLVCYRLQVQQSLE